MNLSEVIYQKSCHLSDDKAQEVLDFIDFLLRRTEQSETAETMVLSNMSPEQRDAFLYLDKVRIDWAGKPITDRDEANARR